MNSGFGRLNISCRTGGSAGTDKGAEDNVSQKGRRFGKLSPLRSFTVHMLQLFPHMAEDEEEDDTSRSLKIDLGYVKSWDSCLSRMTRFSHPVAMQTVVGSFYNHTNFNVVTKPQNTLLRLRYKRNLKTNKKAFCCFCLRKNDNLPLLEEPLQQLEAETKVSFSFSG